MTIQLEHHQINPNGSPYFIAEIGLNHNGDLELAKQMVRLAADCGAHAAKFQLFNAEFFINKHANPGDFPEGSLQNFFKKFEMPEKSWLELSDFSRENGLDFFCSVFDEPSLQLYKNLEPRIIKISSCDLKNTFLIEDIKRIFPNLPVIVSTGTCNEEEIHNFVQNNSFKHLAILQCVSSYPASVSDYNLATIQNWKKKYNATIGLSDHTTNNDLAIAATALGACIIEKHFTSNRQLEGPDQSLSMDPDGFKDMVNRCNQIYKAIGDGKKICTESEYSARNFGGRSLFASKDIARGEKLDKSKTIAQRPGNSGCFSNEIKIILDKKANRDIAAFSNLAVRDFD